MGILQTVRCYACYLLAILFMHLSICSE
uniref:Uncharacterized protein n=1 Tax=Arundo donax TaxID=35708 RepID=A0A0A9C596_ARUDO